MADLKDKVASLPMKPGVYIMKNKQSKVIYVGKAKLLRNRVSSYFRKTDSVKTAMLVKNIDDFDIIVTKTEFEALVLENSLIKKHKPKYNILLKDDKGYPFIKVTNNEDFPQFSVVSKPLGDKNKYYGPYQGRGVAYAAIDVASKIFKLKSCKRQFPRDIGKERPCLNAHLKLCSAPCTGGISSEEYKKLVDKACLIFQGKFDDIQKDLKSQMEVHAENLEFEQAAQIRDSLRTLDKLGERQNVIAGSFADIDVIAFVMGAAKACVVVLHYAQGNLIDKEYSFFDGIDENDYEEVLSSFIKQYYNIRKVCPKTILISHEMEENSLLEEYLGEICLKKPSIVLPQKGIRREYLSLAIENAKEEITRIETREERDNKTLKLLSEKIGIEKIQRIEAFDISNTSGSETVASMVVFQNARPLKRDYRRFKIKSFANGQDDYRAMEEVITRRIENYISGDEKFINLPDVFLIDGGQGHANTAEKVVHKYKINVPVLGMVKDNKHRTRALINSQGQEFDIRSTPVLFTLIGTIQEEVHRFAIEYHRLLRNKKNYMSQLDFIDGVGEARKKALIKSFKTMKGIKEASLDDLIEVVPLKVAENVYKYFKEEENENN